MDLQTVAIGVGLVVSLLFTEVFGLAAGGMIVPGYFALCMDRPADILLTLAVALVTFALARLISKFVILYGRRRIVLMILLGFVLGSLVRALPLVAGGELAAAGAPGDGLLHVIGFIIPGLIALWMDRQGLVETFAPLTTSAVVVRLVLILLGLELAQ